ncbi:hypothetical protein FB567DRAFT_68108 [Paraphoma chrysanthemicola]|uniref:Azaphilone pigments biosynthesis cluster protein L N-terminal domain-containing protein n=1 Tax=Paraphoma chrysanthemicola TaxID=798071 RepID=A0A8K0R4U5_9PLEO|nr:hypothetical protein FB567DRAFT_68108 [Paraphoma chrysanthemicola]
MDPLSITTACVGLVANIGRCSVAITIFVRELRDARGDLAMISNELSSLEMVLVLLRDDFARTSSYTLPATLIKHLGAILKNCDEAVAEIETSLAKHRSSRLGVGGHWTLGGGKDDMHKYRSNLEAHKSALELALDVVNMSLSRETLRNTEDIRHNTAALPAIKNDTMQILEEIARLRARLPNDLPPGAPNIMLQRFLEESTTYAETVVNESIATDPSELPGSTPATSAPHTRQPPVNNTDKLSNFGVNPPPLPYVDFAFYPPERQNDTGHALTPRISQHPNIPARSARTSPTPHTSSRKASTIIDDSASEISRLSLSPEKDFEKARSSPTSSGMLTPPTRPVSSRRHQRVPSGSNIATLGPTLLTEFQNLLRRPDDWKWLTLNHRTHPGNQSLSASELWTHRYTAMTRAPSYLAQLNFPMRQRLDPPRETMLVIGVYYQKSFPAEEFNARYATTIESVAEALDATPEVCGLPSSGIPWWTTVVVCLIHCESHAQSQYLLTRHGLQLKCDPNSEHCGIAPPNILDDERRIYAHFWEHTSSRTKITWNRKGLPEFFHEGGTPIQLVQCEYTTKAGPLENLGSEEHVRPFIQMLHARSCISIAAGDKINHNDIFDAYMTTKHKLSTIKLVDPMHKYPGATFSSSYIHRYGGVPTKIYQESASQFKQEQRSIRTRISSIFG